MSMSLSGILSMVFHSSVTPLFDRLITYFSISQCIGYAVLNVDVGLSCAEGPAALGAAEYGMADKHMPSEAVLERSEFLLPVSSRMMQTHSRLLAK